MKTRFRRFSLGLLLGAAALASVAQTPPSAPPDAAPVDTSAPALSPDLIDQLVGPIALYPDALVALILPASTYSADVVLAARYLDRGGDPAQIESQPWDDSVQALAHYPEVVKWMDENLAWTQQLGDVYLEQQADVMAGIQRDRAKARANGSLVDTPQQKIVLDANGNISIVPAQPEVIYVPRYDPEIIYVDRPVYYGSPLIDFGIGFGIGSWLIYDCDWGQRVIWVGNRHNWHGHQWHRPPSGPGRPPGDWHRWHPRTDRPHPRPHFRGPGPDGRPRPTRPVPHPHPLPGTPSHRYDGDGRPDRGYHRPGSDRHGPPPVAARPAPLPRGDGRPGRFDAPGRGGRPGPERLRPAPEIGRVDRAPARPAPPPHPAARPEVAPRAERPEPPQPRTERPAEARPPRMESPTRSPPASREKPH